MLLALRIIAWLVSYPALVAITHAALQQVSPTTGGIDYAIAAGVPGVLGFLVIGFINEWIVPGRTYRRERERSRTLELTLFKAAGVTEVLAKTAIESDV